MVRNKEIPLDYEAFCKVYTEANNKDADAPKEESNVITPPEYQKADSEPVNEEKPPLPKEEAPMMDVNEEPPRRTRKKRDGV